MIAHVLAQLFIALALLALASGAWASWGMPW